jgi:hypothetical protein
VNDEENRGHQLGQPDLLVRRRRHQPSVSRRALALRDDEANGTGQEILIDSTDESIRSGTL